jgi:alkanesulfonate monooxygenase SsuD/methylene tetrahydromethanopterin reductase-like flavin-dependent oxidoreductase (luciferase family)
MWDEAVREIPKMWKPEPYAYEGEWFRMPERQVLPKPHGAGHPPIWVAAGSPPTFAKAGKMGLGAFCFTHGTPSRIAPLIRSYKDGIAEAEPVGDFVNDNIMVVTNMVCMEDREEAFRVAVSSGMNYYTSLQMHWLDNIPKPEGFPVWPEVIPEPSVEQLKKAAEIGMVVVGDPDDCARSVERWAEIGADQLCFSPTTNNMSEEAVVASMELFGREVIPRFDTDPVHRSTRMRQAAARPVAAGA